MSNRYIIYCDLVGIWVRGVTEDKKVLYTTRKEDAMRYETISKAEDVIELLDPVWHMHMKVIKED